MTADFGSFVAALRTAKLLPSPAPGLTLCAQIRTSLLCDLRNPTDVGRT